MKPRLIATLAVIVLLPLVLLAWLGARVARHEQATVRHQIRELLAGKLRDVDATVAELLAERERALLEATERTRLDVRPLRNWVRSNPHVAAVFVLDDKRERVYPPPPGPLTSAERAFLQRAGPIWRDKHLFYQPQDESAQSAQSRAPASKLPGSRRWVQNVSPSHGWYVWYWGSGLHVAFWRRLPAGRVVGVELDRMRLLADVVAELPAAGPEEPALADGRVALLDAQGAKVYQWGTYEPGEDEEPQATLALSRPLASWKLAYYGSSAELDAALRGGAWFSFAAGFGAVALALGGLAVYFYREHSRAMREAAQRVTFVNQVSHELKTPLTNIRMYAELLEGAMPDEDERAGRYLDIIGSESRRLSRLIGNVLTFARQQKQSLALHPSPGVVDEAVAAVLEHFRPSLEAKRVAIAFERGAPGEVRFDADALEQILGNLFGNVEKYAASGGALSVTTRQEGETTTLTVADKGPGIPASHRERIFDPFHRVSDRLSDGVTGTGIGLPIARQLARLHGGDLTLEPSDEGACFRVTLHTPPATAREGPGRGEESDESAGRRRR
ncbi:MAG: sensor histidine kinase [Planctomycetota bacterium]